MSAYFVSDLHLLDDADPKSQKFIQVLKRFGQAQQWVLLGDIFDTWVADHDYFQKKYAKVVAQLLELKHQGVEIHFFEGNHDFHLKEFWQERFGFHVHPDIARFDWYGKRIRCEHGDLMNPNDVNYIRLRKFLRAPLTRSALFRIPGDIVGKVGDEWSRHSRKNSSKYTSDRADRIVKMMHAYALQETRSDDFDYLITGHTHTRDEFALPPRNGTAPIFLNLGTWLERATVLEINDDGHKFIPVP